MSKLLSVLILSVVTALTGCEKPNIPTSEGKLVGKIGAYNNEICYDQVVYVKFGMGDQSWGGAKFTNDGKVALCNNPSERHWVDEGCYQGVVQVKFGMGNQSWGGAKFGKDSKTVTCGQDEKVMSSASTEIKP